MAKNDVFVSGGAGISPVKKWQTDDWTTSGATATIKGGEPVNAWRDNPHFARLVATGEPESTTLTSRFLGIANEESSEDTDSDGYVNVMFAIPMVTQLTAKATTVANVDTQEEIDALLGDAVTFDLASSKFTIDEDEGDDPNDHGLIIVGGDPDQQTLDVLVKPLVSLFGNNIS